MGVWVQGEWKIGSTLMKCKKKIKKQVAKTKVHKDGHKDRFPNM